jgi:hypothetical protein
MCKNRHVWVMYMYSMEHYLLYCDSGSVSDFSVVYFIEIFNTFVLSQWNLSTIYQMDLCFLSVFNY